MITVRGDKQVIRRLKQFTPNLQRKILRTASRAAAKPVLSAARANAPLRTGRLKSSLKVRAIPKSRVRVGIRVATGAGWFKGKEFYGAFQEFGWKTGSRNSDNRRQVEGRHYVEEAYRQAGPGSLGVFTREIVSGINKGGAK